MKTLSQLFTFVRLALEGKQYDLDLSLDRMTDVLLKSALFITQKTKTKLQFSLRRCRKPAMRGMSYSSETRRLKDRHQNAFSRSYSYRAIMT